MEADNGLIGLGEMGGGREDAKALLRSMKARLLGHDPARLEEPRCCLAAMLHPGAVIPSLTFAAHARYHHLVDDIIEGGLFPYERGAVAGPEGPGLGLRLDRKKLGRHHAWYRRLGTYPCDQDPLRPDWVPLIPNDRSADPQDARPPDMPDAYLS